MKFRTEYIPPLSDIKLSPAKPVVLLGSCFSDNIAKKMRVNLWDAENPAGTLYNPASISKAIRTMLFSLFPEREFEKSLRLNNDKYVSMLFDSKFSAYCAVDCMAEFSSRREILSKKLREGSTLIVTFGTSRVYYTDNDKYPVGNCHKFPASLFRNRILSIDEIASDWIDLAKMMKDKFPDLKIIFTVSPVRHLKDGFIENNRSKARLTLAIEEICNSLDYCDYFPAFEIYNDDLRDYRFYASDLLHPSDEGVEYVWQKFIDTYLDDNAKTLLARCEKISKAFSHRQLKDASRLIPEAEKEKEIKRIESMKEEWMNIKREYPFILSPDSLLQ